MPDAATRHNGTETPQAVTEQVWRCGHPRTPENTTPSRGSDKCRECRRARDRRRYRNKALAGVPRDHSSHSRNNLGPSIEGGQAAYRDSMANSNAVFVKRLLEARA